MLVQPNTIKPVKPALVLLVLKSFLIMVKTKKIILSAKQLEKNAERQQYSRRFHQKEPVSKIATETNKSTRTVRLWLSRWLKDEELIDKPRSGRPKKLSPAQERQLLNAIPAHGRTSSPILLQKTGLGKIVGKRTAQRTVKAAGYNVRTADKKPFLTDDHLLARLNFAKKYQKWTVADWKKVCFTDESTFYKNSGDMKTQCLVKGKKTALHTLYSNKSTSVKVNLFGAIVGSGKVFLQHVPTVNGETYLEVVKKGILKKFFY